MMQTAIRGRHVTPRELLNAVCMTV